MGMGKDSSVTPTSILILSRRGWEGIRLQKCGQTLILEKLLVASSHSSLCSCLYRRSGVDKKKVSCHFLTLLFSFLTACSQQPVPERLRIRVSRISMRDYEALHYDKEKLKEACE